MKPLRGRRPRGSIAGVHRRRMGLGAAGAAVVLVALGVSTLGEESPREVATDYAEAYFGGDLVAACELWGADYRATLLPAYAADGEDPPDDCAELGAQQGDVAEAWPDAGFAMSVGEPRRLGGSAVVALSASGGEESARWQQSMEVELLEQDGRWWVTGFRPPADEGAGGAGG